MSGKERVMSESRFTWGKIGDTVKVQVPDVDRTPGIILQVDADGETYQIGTKEGRLPQKYLRKQFFICEETLFSQEEVWDVIVSARKVQEM